MKSIHSFLLTALLCAVEIEAAERDLILVAGQSNAVGFDAFASEMPASPEDKEVMFWWRVGDPPPDRHDVTSGGWTHLQPQPKGEPIPPPPQPAGTTGKAHRQYGNFAKPEGGFGPEVGLARLLQQREGKGPAVVKVAFSGTALRTDWNPDDDGPGGACYRALIEETKAAIAAAAEQGIKLRPRALVWVQGESDANAEAAPLYEKNLARLLERLRGDLGAPELAALIGVNTRFGNGKNPHVPVVIAAQKALAEKDAQTRYVDTAGSETLPPSHTHFTAQGTLEIGRRFAEALLSHEAAAKR